jgi:hypothetical protein
VRARGFEKRITVDATEAGAGNAAVATLFARETVEDLEMRAASGDEVDDEIECVGLAFGIATRRTSWFAVSDEVAVHPAAATRRTQIPHAVPYGTSVEGLGLRRNPLSALLSVGVASTSGSYSLEDIVEFDEPAFRRRSVEIQACMAPSFDRMLVGRLVRSRDASLVIEFEVGPGPLVWDPERALLRFADHLPSEMAWFTIDRTASTEGGIVEAGLVIRIVFRLASPLPGVPEEIVIESAGESLRVRLQS